MWEYVLPQREVLGATVAGAHDRGPLVVGRVDTDVLIESLGLGNGVLEPLSGRRASVRETHGKGVVDTPPLSEAHSYLFWLTLIQYCEPSMSNLPVVGKKETLS